jgi:hypothetical protein
VRKGIEEIFGWTKTTDCFRKCRYAASSGLAPKTNTLWLPEILVRMAKQLLRGPPVDTGVTPAATVVCLRAVRRRPIARAEPVRRENSEAESHLQPKSTDQITQTGGTAIFLQSATEMKILVKCRMRCFPLYFRLVNRPFGRQALAASSHDDEDPNPCNYCDALRVCR